MRLELEAHVRGQVLNKFGWPGAGSGHVGHHVQHSAALSAGVGAVTEAARGRTLGDQPGKAHLLWEIRSSVLQIFCDVLHT